MKMGVRIDTCIIFALARSDSPLYDKEMPEISSTCSRGAFVNLTAGASLGAFAATSGAVTAQALPAVRVISFPSDAIKQILYPIQNDIFRKRGIAVSLSSMGSGAAIIAAVVGGSAEIGAGSLFPVFTAYGHGIPVRIVAPIAIYDTDHCDSWLMVRKDAPIHAAADLNGKIIGADSPTDIYVIATRVWTDQHGGDGKSIRATALNASEQLAALEQGRIDMCMLRPPFLTLATRSGRFRVLGKPLDVIAPRFLLSCWVATTDYIEKNPANLKAFVAGVVDGARYTNRHQADTIDMVAQFTKQDPAQLREGVRTITADSITLQDVQKPLDCAFKYGVIDRHYDAKEVLSSFVPVG
jgi:NitT/TauT family transport system substrate-binding protein